MEYCVFPLKTRVKPDVSSLSQLRPPLAVRGEVPTMAPPSQDPTVTSMAGRLPLLLLFLLFLPCGFAQNPAPPNVSPFDPLTHPECTKKEHPKVSIQGQTCWVLLDVGRDLRGAMRKQAFSQQLSLISALWWRVWLLLDVMRFPQRRKHKVDV